ncbi:MAG: FHA domain-containing protein [Blastocatellia bacterium]
MNPRLIALAGPLRGATRELSAKEFYIGRDPHSQLCLDDRLVSRQHASSSRLTGRSTSFHSPHSWMNGTNIWSNATRSAI